MDQEPDTDEDRIPIFTAATEYRLATGFNVRRPRELVYLEFLQLDPAEDRAVGVGRIALAPVVLDQLIAKLSAVRRPAD